MNNNKRESIIPSVYEDLTGINKNHPLGHGLYLLDMH